MEKLKMQTANKADENFKKLAEMFPNAVTESIDEVTGEVVRAIDKDILMQEINTKVVEGREERYQFTWPDKKKSILLANSPITKTLRPCPEESVDFDNTENLYIEGDNLEILKLLQETYLGKIKMIYIDPPYNTGNDFVYNDKFDIDSEEWNKISGDYNEYGERMVKNLESNDRYHTDWLNMIYPRLKIARDLLTDDGVIFISIDDNEVENLKKVCDEIFGRANFLGEIVRKTKSMTADNNNGFNLQHESLYIFAKNKNTVILEGERKSFDNYKNPDEDPNGDWCAGDPSARSGGETTYFGITNPYTNKVDYPPNGRYWAFSESTLKKYIASGKVKFKTEYSDNERGFIFKRYKKDADSLYDPVHSLFATTNEFMNQNATVETKRLFDNDIFSYPKPVSYIKKLVQYAVTPNSIIIDFFSGSATTAHAVMQLNAEDGGNRKFIMVQLPEHIDEKSEAYKAGYKNICEIGKERIRRAGTQIIHNSQCIMHNEKCSGKDCENYELCIKNSKLDVGFRVLKCDTSNMKEVYYNPSEYGQAMLDDLVSNIKEDRTAEDLLFQVMLDLGILLSSKIEQKEINGKKVYSVADNFLMACFDDNITDDVITRIAKQQPYYFVMRDGSLASDCTSVNFEQIFTTYSPDTVRRVI